MNLDGLKVGMSFKFETKVGEAQTATAMASGTLPVFSTPYLIAYMEWASLNAVSEALPPGASTVGTKVDIEHLAATPLGMDVKFHSELIGIDKRRLIFRVEAWDTKELIGQGTHERFVVDDEKFTKKCNGKLS